MHRERTAEGFNLLVIAFSDLGFHPDSFPYEALGSVSLV